MRRVLVVLLVVGACSKDDARECRRHFAKVYVEKTAGLEVDGTIKLSGVHNEAFNGSLGPNLAAEIASARTDYETVRARVQALTPCSDETKKLQADVLETIDATLAAVKRVDDAHRAGRLADFEAATQQLSVAEVRMMAVDHRLVAFGGE
jgi:hypothetical protein